MSALSSFQSHVKWYQGRPIDLADLPLTVMSIVCSGLVWVSPPALAQAADPGSKSPSEPASSAAEYVMQALGAEAEGDLVARDRLLTLASECNSDCEAAQWQRGLIKTDAGGWQSIEGCTAAGAADTSLDAYEARRLIMIDNVAGHWQMALWCQQNRYPDQARAHAQYTLELEPDHEAARRLLGFRFMNGQWMSAAEWKEFERRAGDVRRGLDKYGKRLGEIARGFRAHDAEARSQAREKLMNITEPIAIAPVEAILGSLNADAAQAVVGWLAQLRDPEASRAMVRLAMFHPEAQTRELAIERLKDRPYHDYVPDLLQMLSSPVASMSLPIVGRDGTLNGFRQAFVQERQKGNDVVIVQTSMNYGTGDPTNRVTVQNEETAARELLTQVEAYERATQRVAETDAAVQTNNQQIVARNRRVAQVMSEITDREFSGTPTEMWQWWDSFNETEQQSLKRSSVRYRSTAMNTRSYAEQVAAIASRNVVAGHECFVRGTPVITRRGSRPIESVRVGDLVLSRDVPSGELGWKPVVRTTIRPPRPTYEITLDDGTLRCTGGHLFWVSGQGWTKASQLRGGDVLHGAASPAVVMKVVRGPEETTYNLAVEATQTYFVGKQMVLSHDVTDRVPTYITVPGLTAASAH